MKMLVEAVNGESLQIRNITQLSFIQSADAACDSVWAYFKSENAFEEIVSIKLLDGDELIFNGYCDCQKTIEDENGFRIYIYARSGAALLVDNQAKPNAYSNPTGKQLCYMYALPYGIKCGLPEIFSKEDYQVSGGTSCYGAINQFVYFCTGYNIAVTPENELRLLKPSSDVKRLDECTVLSVKSTINRSEPLSVINFKDTLSEAGYNHHTVCGLAEERKIERARYVNLNSLAKWQRSNTILQQLKGSFDSYRLLEVEVSGFVNEPLLQRFDFTSRAGDFNNYMLVEKRYTSDENGSVTRLTLRETIEIKENTYVD